MSFQTKTPKNAWANSQDCPTYVRACELRGPRPFSPQPLGREEGRATARDQRPGPAEERGEGRSQGEGPIP